METWPQTTTLGPEKVTSSPTGLSEASSGSRLSPACVQDPGRKIPASKCLPTPQSSKQHKRENNEKTFIRASHFLLPSHIHLSYRNSCLIPLKWSQGWEYEGGKGFALTIHP